MTLLRPSETQVFSGNHVARQKAEGIEFADIRQFVAGDRVRHVNWRATARRGELWVNEASRGTQCGRGDFPGRVRRGAPW